MKVSVLSSDTSCCSTRTRDTQGLRLRALTRGVPLRNLLRYALPLDCIERVAVAVLYRISRSTSFED